MYSVFRCYHMSQIPDSLPCRTATDDVCHAKTDRKVFVVVIPKEGLAGPSSMGMTTSTEYYSAFLDYILLSVPYLKKDWQAVPKEGLVGPPPANPSLGMTMIKTLRSVFS